MECAVPRRGGKLMDVNTFLNGFVLMSVVLFSSSVVIFLICALAALTYKRWPYFMFIKMVDFTFKTLSKKETRND
jgi:hypothetical protein